MTLIETMELSAPHERVWEILVESGGAVRLVPGLSVSEDGRGSLRVTLGGHAVTYRGYARQHLDEPGRRVTWTLSGREVRGSGRGHVEVRARLRETTSGVTDLRLTVLVDGRGRLDEVSPEVRDRAVSSLIGRFRRALESELQSAQPGSVQGEAATAPEGPRLSAIPELEIVPPSPDGGGRHRQSIAFVLGGLLLGSLAVAIWRWRFSRRR